MIVTVTMNPAIDKTACVDELLVGELNRLQQVISNPGGKGINVSKTIHALKGDSLATGFIAGSNGHYIVDFLNQSGISNDMVEVDGNTRVNLKVLNKHMVLTELNEIGPSISSDAIQALIDKIEKHIDKGDILVLSGSVPQGVPCDIYAKITRLAKNKGVDVILDADESLFEEAIKENPTIIKPNKYELCKHYKISEEISTEKVIELGRELLIQNKIELCVISLGEAGALFIKQDECAIVNGLKIKIHSSVGAGDAMVAALAYARQEQFTFEKTIRLAIATSAGACMTEGTAPADLDIINELMNRVEITMMKEGAM